MGFAPSQREDGFHGDAGQKTAARTLAIGASFGDYVGLADVLQALDAHAHQRDLRESGARVVIHGDRLARFAVRADHAPNAPTRRRRRRILYGHPFSGGADFAQPADSIVGRLRFHYAASLDFPSCQDIGDHVTVES
ncbi:MAG TPA: hypothetical protein VL522_13580 [Bordetella sp.]|nr:hypothetical protein [Bordetella sp.]